MGQIANTRKLYKEKIDSITKTEENWLSFLDSSSWHFKYNFVDKVLIYAQRPEATACAEMENEWNRKCRRWVNKDAKGIFVLAKDEDSPYPFRLVFDVSDTHNSKGTEYKLWSVKPEYEEKIIETLQTTFGGETESNQLSENIIINAYNMVTDNIQDYLSSIHQNKKGTILENLSDDEVQNITVATVWASVSYMMMTRCGINAREKINIQEFTFIKEFNNDKIITALGTAISDIAEMGLREIAKTVINLQNEEKNINHTFVKNKEQEYSNNKEIEKGGIRNGENRIQESWRLSNTKSSNGERADTKWKIRKNEASLSKEPQESRLFDIIDGQEIKRRIESNSRDGNTNGQRDSGETSQTRWNNRGIESTRPNEMGRTNAELQVNGRGTSNEGVNLQLEENRNIWIDKNEKVIFNDYETIDKILSNAPNILKNQDNLATHLKFNTDEERQKYISNILGNAYTEYVIDENQRVGYKSYDNGLYLWKGDYLNRTEECFRTWNEITEYFVGNNLNRENENIVNDLQTENEQIQNITEVEDTSVFSFSQEEIDNALKIGSGVVDGKYRIYEYLSRGLSSKENAEFLKNEYGIGETSENEDGIAKWYDSKGLTISRGSGENAPTLKLSWRDVEKRIRELISSNRYLTDYQQDQYYDWLDVNGITPNNAEEQIKDEDYKLAERLHNYMMNYDIVAYHNNFSLDNTIEQNIELLQADINDEMNIQDYIDFLKASYEDLDYDDETSVEARSLILELEKRLPYYEFHNGDIVYIGADEFEIRAIDNDRAVLVDTSFPLYTKEMPREEFEKKVKDNPANDKLRTGIKNEERQKNYKNEETNETVKEFIERIVKQYKISEKCEIEVKNGRVETLRLDEKFYTICLEILKNLKFLTKDIVTDDDKIKFEYFLKQEKVNEEKYLIGKEIELFEQGKFKITDIEELEDQADLVILENVDTKELTKESILQIHYQVNKQIEDIIVEKVVKEENLIKPQIKRKRRNKIEYFDLHPEIPIAERNNFKIDNNDLGISGKKEKYKNNIEAIKVLKLCEEQNRYATKEEQEILSKYVGWGGIPEAFDSRIDNWHNEYEELKSLLTEKEYKEAKKSTLTAFYTPPIVIRSIYRALENMGLERGNILEPSCRYW